MLQAIRDEHEIIPKIERWRELNQLAKTYLDALPAHIGADGRLHTTFIQTAATTGRLSLDQPEPAERPDPHGAGPRDPRLLRGRARQRAAVAPTTRRSSCACSPTSPTSRCCKEIFMRGEDVHTATASQVFGLPAEQLDVGMRSKAKMVNYGIVYGLSDYGLADRLEHPARGGAGRSSTATSSASRAVARS